MDELPIAGIIVIIALIRVKLEVLQRVFMLWGASVQVQELIIVIMLEKWRLVSMWEVCPDILKPIMVIMLGVYLVELV